MKQPRIFTALACLLISVVALSGCGQEAENAPTTSASGVPLRGDFTGPGLTPGALTSANTLPTVDRRLRASASLAARIEYTSTSGITGELTQVTGSVFVPKGQAPAGGWPIIAYGHGTTGIESECAPSLSQNLLGSASVVMTMVRAGYLVVLPDYQGLGLDETYHPYLDATTVGYNMIDSVRATRKLVPETSDRWVAVGMSQGGQAAWAANELAGSYGAGLALLGAVSVSPPTDMTGFADAAASGTLTREQLPAMQLILATLKKEHPDLDLGDYRRGIVAEKWSLLSSCEGPDMAERAKVTAQIAADDVRPATPEAVERLRGFLEEMSLPRAPTIAPMLVVYGGKDPFLPAEWIDRALWEACAMGDVIDIQMQPEGGHADIDVSMVFRWILERFTDLPAPNSCQSFMAAGI